MQTIKDEAVVGSATFSSDRACRFLLSRWWVPEAKGALVCMANPSSAGAEKNDPTISRLIRLVRAQGYGAVNVVNWCPLIGSNPTEVITKWKLLYHHDRELWQEMFDYNLKTIRSVANDSYLRFVAWGNIIPVLDDSAALRAALTNDGVYPVYAFSLTLNQNPMHPLARGRNRIKAGEHPKRFETLRWQKIDDAGSVITQAVRKL